MQATTQQSNIEAWIAAPRGYANINVDAAVRKQGRIGALAALCRSDDGLFLGASTIVRRGIIDPTILEALACREALALVLDLQLTKVKIATYCLEVIKSMEGSYLRKCSTIIQEIKLHTSDFASLLLVHERRVLNMKAHGLARASAYCELGCHVDVEKSGGCLP
jgi:ribonuclease HI